MNGRALYNTLRINWVRDPSLPIQPWQVENYRDLPLARLFEALSELGLKLDEPRFLAYAEEADSPEQLSELLCPDEWEEESCARAYLFLFEVWRRLMPQCRSLSVLCDDLDQFIAAWERERPIDEEALLFALEELESLLEESVDAGTSPREALATIAAWSAHDLEGFLHSYISELISRDETVASELLSGFAPYVEDPLPFDLLLVRLLLESDPEHGLAMLERILEELEEEPDLDLLVELLEIAHHATEEEIAQRAAIAAASHLSTNEDLQLLLSELIPTAEEMRWPAAPQLAALQLKTKDHPSESPLTGDEPSLITSLLQ